MLGQYHVRDKGGCLPDEEVKKMTTEQRDDYCFKKCYDIAVCDPVGFKHLKITQSISFVLIIVTCAIVGTALFYTVLDIFWAWFLLIGCIVGGVVLGWYSILLIGVSRTT